MWADVAQQLTNILGSEIFGALLNTPAYMVFLRKGGLSGPLSEFAKDKHAPFPPSFEPTCVLYAKLITSQVKELDCLAEDHTLRAEVIRGPVRLFRLTNSRTKTSQVQDLRRGTADIGDWWFHGELLEACILHCRALAQGQRQNPLLTDMSPDRCLKTQLRRKLAIRMDWNQMGAIRQLVVEPNESIPVITGVGLPQRTISTDAVWREFPAKALPVGNMRLPGGERQIWIPWTPQKQIQLWTPKGGLTPNAQL